jgi:phage-related protein
MSTQLNGGQIQFSAVIDTDEFDSGLKKVGNTLDAIGKTAAVAAIAIAGAATAAVTGVVAASVKSFAQFEQMTGGIETLYKESAGQVQQFAIQAMATTGLTANQYMETLTSFSGTLLRGLQGDTAKAAQIGNMAVNDMADNAATFGTSMDTIRDTYQSLARGNFEMLDSLNLGFAGTQQGMADLINSSGVMGAGFVATAENIKNIPFDKYLEAIHQVQVQQGLTGTAAEEAMKTISGSLGMTQAAWGNLLTAFGTGNTKMITDSFDAMVQGATALVTNVVAIVPKIIDGINQVIQVIPAAIAGILPIIVPAINSILTAIINIIPQIVPAFISIIMSLVTVVLDNLPRFLDAAVGIIVSIVTGLAQAAPQLIPMILNAVNSMVDTIIKNLPAIIDAGIQILLAIIIGITNALPQLIPKIMEVVKTAGQTLLDHLPEIITAGIQLLVAVIQGISQAMPVLAQYIPQVINTIVQALTTPAMLNLMIHASWDIMFALAKGIIQALPQLLDGVHQIGDSIDKGIRNYINAMNQAGIDLIVGLWNGIANKRDWIVNQIKGFGSSVINSIKGIFGIHSPSTVFRDQIGKNLALGLGEGFVNTMDDVSKQMNMAIPVSDFDVNMMSNGSYSSSAPSQPVQVVVKVGEDQIASKLIDLINDRSRLGGNNAIFV